MRYVSLRGNLEAPRWIIYVSFALIVAGLALLALGIAANGPAARPIIGGVLAALGACAAVVFIRKRS